MLIEKGRITGGILGLGGCFVGHMLGEPPLLLTLCVATLVVLVCLTKWPNHKNTIQ